MRSIIPIIGIGIAFLAAAALAQTPTRQKKPQHKSVVSYRDVAPILQGVCGECHKGKRPAHGLDLTTYAKTMKGDRQGKVVVPRNLKKSRLITVLHGKPLLMPPGDALKRAQIQKIESWVASGAKEK